MSPLTPELQRAIRDAGDQPVRLEDPETRIAYVLIRAEDYDRLRAIREDEEDRRERESWARLGRKARSEWARENPY